VGIDRGVTVSAALSTGEMLSVPGLTTREQARLRRLERRLARARNGSARRGKARTAVGRLKARETDRRKDWTEKTSTDIARRFDVIRVEDLKIRNMIRSAKGTAEQPGRNVRAKAGLNRKISRSGWGLLVRRLQDKAPRPGRKGTSRLHEPAVLGVRARGREIAREPSALPLHCLRIRLHCLRIRLQRRRERGTQHRGGARRESAGRRRH
jgi:hypothetical protein